MNICQAAKCWHCIFAIWQQYPLTVSKSWFVFFMVILTPWFHRSPLCNVTCPTLFCSTLHKKPVPQRRLPPIKLQIGRLLSGVHLFHSNNSPEISHIYTMCILRSPSPPCSRVAHRGKNNTALVIVKHHHGQFYIMSVSWEWCFIAWGWVEHPPSHTHTVYCHFHCGYFFFPGKLRCLWGSDARQCCSLLNSWHSIHAAIHLKRLSALCTICHHKQQDIFPAWIITEVNLLCHRMVDFQNFLSASYVGKHHLPGTASCSKQMPKIQFDPSLEAIWLPAALVSHQVRASLPILIH